jgi:predicted Na+-dependent transporter
VLERLEQVFLPMVVAAALLGLFTSGPAGDLVDRHGIDVVLAVLVFASALSVPGGWLGELRVLAWRLGLVIAATTIGLPLLAFGLSHLLVGAEMRDAMLSIGVAPAEVASVAVASIAGSRVAVAAALLIASTLASVVAAGPILSVLAGSGVSPTGVLMTLVVVVAIPLALGLLARDRVALLPDGPRLAEATSIIAVVILVWLVSSQAHLNLSYVRIAVVLVLFIAISAGAGRLTSLGMPQTVSTAIVLDVSMRDFAIASGIATAAFGPQAAGPLALYGVLVMSWGAIAARLLRSTG